jgi:PEP-CTERM motif
MNFKKTYLVAMAGLVAMLVANSASAYIINIGGDGNPGGVLGEKSIVLGAVTTDFNANLLNPTGYTGGAVKNGSVPNQWASPPADTSNFFTVGPSTSTPGTVSFGFLASYFGYYGGSPDTYNSISFLSGGEVIKTFTGAQLATEAGVNPDGDQGVGRYWNFTAANPGEYFDSVQFISTKNAFETDNHAVLAAAVPEPETYAMMLAGFGMMGFMVRRRKNQL